MSKTQQQLAEELISVIKKLQPTFSISNGKLTDSNSTISLELYARNTIRDNTVSYR
jgi:hypothetical protein